MTTILWLHSAATSFVGLVVERSLIMAVAFGVIFILWMPLKRFMTATASHGLLLAPMLLLILPLERCIPFHIEAPLKTYTRISESPIRPTPNESPSTASSNSRKSTISATLPAGSMVEVDIPMRDSPRLEKFNVDPLPNDSESVVPLALWICSGWLVIVIFLGSQFLYSHGRVRRLISRAKKFEDHRLEVLFRRVCDEAKVTRPIRLLKSTQFASPAAYGLRRPAIVLPPELLKVLNDEQLYWVLMHEVAHVKRHDLVTAFVQRAIQILYCFHPLVWVANAMADRYREYACDDFARSHQVGTLGHECARAFLTVVEMTNRRRSPALLAMYDRKSLVRNRLMRLLKSRHRNSGPVMVTSWIVIVVGSLSGLSVARSLVQDVPVQDPSVQARPAQEAQLSIFQADESPSNSQPSRSLRDAIERSVDWLVAMQAEDGSWDCQDKSALIAMDDTAEKGVDPFSSSTTLKRLKPMRESDARAGARSVTSRVASTGMALLGIMESVRLMEDPKVTHAWTQGIHYLLKQQSEKDFGLIRERGALQASGMYAHLMATQALLKSLQYRDDEALRSACSMALVPITRARNPYLGWRYGTIPSGENDSSMTGLAMLTLLSARSAGLTTDDFAFQGGLDFLDEMTDLVSGRTGYMEKGSFSARLAETSERFPHEGTEALTALCLCVRLAMGQDARSDVIRKGVALLMQEPPEWSKERGSIDLYYWLFGTAAMKAIGGKGLEQWNESLVSALLPVQEPNGSWSPVGAWGTEGGVVYSTVFSLLALAHVDD